MRLATVESIELLRGRYREGRNRDPLKHEELWDGNEPSPVQEAQAGELVDALRVALANLEQRQAEVFCLACLEGYSYQQIADQLNLKRNHVGVLLNRARTKLRDELAAHIPVSVEDIFDQERQS